MNSNDNGRKIIFPFTDIPIPLRWIELFTTKTIYREILFNKSTKVSGFKIPNVTNKANCANYRGIRSKGIKNHA